MSYINQVISQYGGLLSQINNIVGIAGFLFGVWRYYEERKTKKNLIQTEEELEKARARLDHLRDLASAAKKYFPAAVT